jgi:hypothetical protein
MDVAVVSHNTKELLERCLATVTGQDALGRVVVADDGSTDGSIEMVRDRFPETLVITTGGGTGFGGSANRALDACTAPLVLLLNSDTYLEPGTIRALASYIDAHPHAALVGPRLLNADGRLQRSCFPFPSPWNALLGETGLGFFLRFVPVLRARHLRTWPHDRPRVVPWVRGAALVVRRDVFTQVGGFDPAFFMYFEETDLARRMSAAGWEVHFAPVTDVYHVGGASTGQRRAEMTVQYYSSMEAFYRRHRKPWERAVLRAILRATKRLALMRDRVRLWFVTAPAARARLHANVEAWRRILASV